MATLTLTFPDPLNISLQIGDTTYFVKTSSRGGFLTSLDSTASYASDYASTELGTVASITQNTNTITVTSSLTVADLAALQATESDYYIYFSKDNKANLSSLLGYYAEVKFKNTSTTEAELFSISADTFESSK